MNTSAKILCCIFVWVSSYVSLTHAAPLETTTTIQVEGQRTIEDTSAPRRHISREDIEKSSRGSLFETIAQETPGVYVNARGPFHGISFGASGSVRIRGLGGSPNTQILVFDDGVPDMMGLFGHPVPDTYIPAYIASIDVNPGGDSILFGNGALGGTLQLRTRWRTEKGREIRALGEYGSYETVTLQPGILGSDHGVQYLASVRATHSNGHRDFAGGDEIGSIAKAKIQLRKDVELTIRQRTLIAKTFDPGPTSRPYFNRSIDFDRANQSLTLQHHTTNIEGRATLYANLGFNRIYDGFRSNDQLYGLWLEEAISPVRSLQMIFGLDARSMGGRGRNIMSSEDFGEHRAALLDWFHQSTYSPLQWLTVVAGGRVHQAQQRNPLWLGKLGVEAKISTELRIAARYTEGYRDPTVVELYFPFPVANRNLRSEQSSTTEVTLGWRKGNTFEVEATGYQMHARDYIRTLGAFPSFQSANIDSVTLWGAEAFLRLKIWGPFALRATTSITKLGPYTAQTPSHTFSGSLVFDDRQQWRATISTYYAGGLHQKDFEQNPLVAPWFIDVRCDRTFIQSNVRIWLTIRNLTNRRYAFIEEYVMPGINALAGLELTL